MKKAVHLEWVGPIVFNEEKSDLPEEKYHRQQTHVEEDTRVSHQQIEKIIGLGDMASSAFANTGNWCSLILER